MKALLAVLALSFSLVGCWKSAPTPKPQPSPTTQTKVETITKEQGESAAAHVEAARKANAEAPESPAKVATEGSLQTAATALPVPPADKVAEAMKPVLLTLAGQHDKATELWGKAQAGIAETQAKLDAAKQELINERAASAMALDELNRKHAAEVEVERQKARSHVLDQQVRWLNIAGGVFALGFGLSVAFGGLALLQRGAWVLGLFALMSFGLAQIVGAWWFIWAVGGVCLAAAGVFAWYCIKHKSAQAGLDALKPVLKTLDDAYDNALPDTKALLDSKIFDPLSRLMDKAQKATIHDARKDAQ